MTNVQLIDGFNFVRASLRALISVNDELHLMAEAKDPASAIGNLKKHSIDVVVLDVSIPEKNGLEVLADIKFVYPDIPTLIINGSEQADFAANFLLQGCHGYISNQCKYEDIIEGIKEVSEGREYIQPSHLHEQTKSSLHRMKDHHVLSRRELQVFFKLVTGKSNSAIAAELSISSSTVSVFKSSIYRKMHFRNNADLIVYALNNHCSTQISPMH